MRYEFFGGAYIWRGDSTEGFLRYEFFWGGLYLEGLYIKGLILGILRYSLLLPRYTVIMTKSSNPRGGDLWVDFKNCAYLWKSLFLINQ